MKNKDQPAFPMYNELGNLNAEGLTKREYFAGLAMQGILASDPEFSCQPSELAKRSIECADALLTNL